MDGWYNYYNLCHRFETEERIKVLFLVEAILLRQTLDLPYKYCGGGFFLAYEDFPRGSVCMCVCVVGGGGGGRREGLMTESPPAL